MARYSVDTILNLYLKLSRKNRAGSMGTTDFFRLWNAEQSAYHDAIVEGPAGGLILSEKALQKLAPFTLSIPLTVAAGTCAKPEDIVYRLAVRINGKNAKFIHHGQIADVNDSVIDPPSVTDDAYYYYELRENYYFLPNTITAATLDYVASCEDVKWAYTFDAQNRQVYNPSASVQPKWSNNTIVDITKRCFTGIGLSYKDRDFIAFGQQAQAQNPA